jgi:hypothetical protein
VSTHFLVTPLEKIVQANLNMNQSSSTISPKIHSKDITMTTLEKVPEDASKAFEEHMRAAEERRKVAKIKEL